MADSFRAADDGDRSGEEGTVGEDRTARPPWTPELRLTVVEYDRRPDRATIHPRGLTGFERMDTWISADRSAFVDLSGHR